MLNNVQKTIHSIRETYQNNDFTPIILDRITIEEKKYGQLPHNLKELYLELGSGRISDGSFYIHFLLEPNDVYDEITAKNLSGKVIVGDDSCGDCYAYDYQNNWEFGYIDCNGEFNKYSEYYQDFIDYLYQLTLREKN